MAKAVLYTCPLPCDLVVPDRSLFAHPLNLGWPADWHWHVADMTESVLRMGRKGLSVFLLLLSSTPLSS